MFKTFYSRPQTDGMIHFSFNIDRLKITLDSEQPMLKEKRIIPSVWGGIKGFELFLRGEYFSDCASD